MWYFIMLQLQTEETQLNGVVWILYDCTSNGMALKLISSMMYSMESSLPLRTIASHICFENDDNFLYLNGFKFHCKEFERLRIFGHLGTSEEIAFKLQTYGIPIDSGPLQIDGTWSLSFHKEYLENLRISEDNEWQQDLCNIQPMELVVPNNKDVLLGRSTKAVSHVGNQQLHHLVEDHFEAYSAATKVQKTEIAWKLVDFIQKTGGRFLKNVEELGWMEVTRQQWFVAGTFRNDV